MAMGTTERVVLDGEMQVAKQKCAEFRATMQGYVKELEDCIATLLSDGFQGEAASGLKDFYDKYIGAFFAAGGTFDQYLAMFDKDGEGLFDGIEKAMIIGEGIDPTLGQNNKSIGQSEGTN